jgi:hypothetical protein
LSDNGSRTFIGFTNDYAAFIKKMIKQILSSILAKNKALLLHEANKTNDFMRLLMKHSNTRNTWTKEEREILRVHLWRLSSYIPVLFIFCLPGGSLLFPLLAEILDRRKNRRAAAEQNAKEKQNNNNLASGS